MTFTTPRVVFADDPPARFARHVATTLKAHGHEAWFAGGAVRDLLLGLHPHEYDIATSATPDVVATLFPKALLVGAQFGVVVVVDPTDTTRHVEVATFRVEGGYRDGRHPGEVHFATAREDVTRRDFTINGLLADTDTGEVHDWVNGINDLNRRLVRAIGDPRARFAEDRLRMLRAVRFTARLGFTLDLATEDAIRQHAPAIVEVSAERIRDELQKLLQCGHAGRAFRLLDRLDLLRVILPEVTAMHDVAQPPQYHPEGDVFIHTMLLLDQVQPTDHPLVGWGCLLHDIGKPRTFMLVDRIRFNNHEAVGSEMTRAICERLRFSNDDTDLLVAMVRDHGKFAHVKLMRVSTLKRFIWRDHFDAHLTLHRYDCLASHRDLSAHDFVREKLAEWGSGEAARPQRLATGSDLIALGLKPSPQFGDWLRELDDAQLEGIISTREEAVAFLAALAKRV